MFSATYQGRLLSQGCIQQLCNSYVYIKLIVYNSEFYFLVVLFFGRKITCIINNPIEAKLKNIILKTLLICGNISKHLFF